MKLTNSLKHSKTKIEHSKYVFHFLFLILFFVGCNSKGGKGGSSLVQSGSSPTLQAPGAFSIGQVRAGHGRAVLSWTNSSRVSSYSLSYGTNPANISTVLPGCSGMVSSCVVSNLIDGIPYYFKVTASNSGGNTSAISSSVTPVGPFDVTSVSVGINEAALSWSVSPFADTYEVRYGTSAGSFPNVVTTSGSTPYTITGLDNGVTYFFQVIAKNSTGGYLISPTEISSSPVGTPNAPTNLEVASAGNDLQLNWDSVLGATSYRIFRGTTSANLALYESNVLTNSYLDISSAPGTSYFYQVKAFNGQESTLSSMVEAKSIGSFTLNSVDIGGAPEQLVVTWGPAIGSDSYDLLVGTASEFYTTRITGVNSPYTIQSLSPGTTYYIKVEAKNTVGAGSVRLSTNELSGVPVPVLTAPVAPTLSASPGVVSLNWPAISGATSYQVLRGINLGSLSVLAPTVTGASYSDTTVQNGITYHYAIKASNGSLTPPSPVSSIRPIGSFAISNYTSPTSTSLQVTWSAAQGSTSYDLSYGLTPSTLTNVLTNVSSPLTLSGLTQGSPYYVSVKAKNALTVPVVSQTPVILMRTVPNAPTGLTAVGSSGSVSLSWNVVSGASSYQVYRGSTSGSYTLIEGSAPSNSFVDSTVTNGSTYFYAVKSTNVIQSEYSNETSIRTIASFSPVSFIPQTSSSIELTWSAVAGASSFDIIYGTSAGSLTSTLTNVTSPYTITGLLPNVTYYAALVAKNTIGAGTEITSSTISGKTQTLGPTNLLASTVPDEVHLSWSGVAGADSYKILRGTTSGTFTEIAAGILGTTYTDTTVTNGTIYYYVVRSYNGSDSGNSNEVQAQAIQNFSITDLEVTSASSITATWGPSLGSSSFDLLYGTTSGTHPTLLTNVTSPYVITGLTPNTTYYVIVRGKNNVGAGSMFETAESSALTAFGAPTGLVAAGRKNQVDLNWSSVIGASHYKVLRGTSPGSYSEIASTVLVNSYSDLSAVDGTRYYYVVRAFNGTSSANSNEASGKSLSSFTISITPTSSTALSVSWSGVAGAETYDLAYGTSSHNYSGTLTGVSSPAALTGLAPGQTYFVTVTARNSIGSGGEADSDEASGTTSLSAPTTLAGSATPGSVNLTWSLVPGATSYKIFRGTSSGAHTQIASGITQSSYIDSSASNGTEYFYVFRAFNGTDSANSNEVTIKPIATFGNISLDSTSSTSLTMTFDSVSGADNYEIVYGTSSGSYSQTLTNVTSPYVISSLAPNTTYYAVLKSKNAVGLGTQVSSTEQTATTTTSAPSLSLSTIPGEVHLSWGAITGAASYNIYRGTSAGTQTLLLAGHTSTTYTDSTVANGTSYFYSVKAFNGSESAASNTMSGKSIQSFTITSVTSTDSTKLSVVFPASAGSDTFDVAWGTSSGSYPNVLPNVTSPYEITGLSPGSVYYVVVRGKNAVGTGSSFETAVVSQTTSLAPPSGITLTAIPSKVDVSWSAVVGSTGYNVLRGTTSGALTLLAANVSGTTYADLTTAPGTTYFYALQTLNGSSSVSSSEVSVKPVSSFNISSVTVDSSTSLTVNFSAATGADSYDLAYSSTSGTHSTVVPNVTSPVTVSGLTAGTTYYFVVRGKNSVGSGTTFETAQVDGLTAADAPGTLSLIGTPGSVALSWTATPGASSYRIYRGTASGSLTLFQSGVSGNTFSDSTVVNGTTYFYTVSSFNGSESLPSNERSVQTINNFTMTTLTVASSTSLTATWAAATGAATYNISYGTTSGTYSQTLSGVTSPYTITGLASGPTYYVRVIALNAVGNGTTIESTNELSKQTNAPPVIGAIADQIMEADSSLAVNFTLTDSDSAMDCVTSTVKVSSNTSLIPDANVVLSGTAPNCVATITPLASQTGSSNITLTATDGVESDSKTFAVTVNPCTVAFVQWETQPVGMIAGNVFATSPRLSTRKADNTICTTDTTPIELSINDDFSVQQDAELTAGSSVTPVNGYALFNAARMTRAGTNFTLVATQGSVQSVESSVFTVSAGAVSKIVFSVQPSPTDKLATMVASPTVRTADTYNNYKNATAAFSVTLSLDNNTVGAALSGTVTRTTSTAGLIAFPALSVNKESTYKLKATTTAWGTALSDDFEIAPIIPQAFVTSLELIQSPVNHPSGSVSYTRSSNYFGTAVMDGTISYSFEIVAQNTSASPVIVRLRRSTTNIAFVTVPANTTTPTYYSVPVTTSLINTTNSAYMVRVEGSTTKVLSARIIAKQVDAFRSQVYIPLSSIPHDAASPTVTTNSTTAVNIDDKLFPSWTWNASKIKKIDSAYFLIVIKGGGGSANSCVRLVNKTTGLIIGTEKCTTSTTETLTTNVITPSSIPDGAVLEARVRTSNATYPAHIYKAGLVLKLVNIQNAYSVQIAAPAVLSLGTGSTFFTGSRVKDFGNDFGTGVVNQRLKCMAKSLTAGLGNFELFDHGSSVSGTAGASSVALISLSFTNESSVVEKTSVPVAVTENNYHFVGFQGSSGTFALNQCLYLHEVSY